MPKANKNLKYIKYNRKGIEFEPFCRRILPANPKIEVVLAVDPEFAIYDTCCAIDSNQRIAVGKLSIDLDYTDLSILDQNDVSSVIYFKLLVNADTPDNAVVLANMVTGIPSKDVIGKIVNVSYEVE